MRLRSMKALTLKNSSAPEHEEERDDEQHRHDADEDVGQDQLAADPPQQLPLDVE